MTIHLPENLEVSILEVVRSGQFASVDDAMAEAAQMLLERIHQAQPSPEPPTSPQEPGSVARKPIWDRILERAAEIPDEEWDKLPTDSVGPARSLRLRQHGSAQ